MSSRTSVADVPAKNRVHSGYTTLSYFDILSVGLRGIYDNDPLRHVSVPFPDADETRLEYAKVLADLASTFNKCST